MKHSHSLWAKLLTLCMAIVLALGMVSTASAEKTVNGVAINLGKELSLKKGANVPNATFKFTIASIEKAIDATDLTFTHGTLRIEPGPDPDKVLMGNAIFAPTDTATADPDDATKLLIAHPFTVDLSQVTFTEPGVFRYVITESDNDPAIDGVTNDDDPTRYLDVYVVSDADGNLSISGYYVYKVTKDGEKKIGGDDSDEEYAGDGPAAYRNIYDTYDLTLSKNVDGNQAFRDKYFKFTVAIENAAKGTKYTVDLTGADPKYDGTDQPAEFSADGNGKVTVVYYLKHGQSVKIQGLTAATKYTITEDDYQLEGYKTTFEQTDMTKPENMPHTPATTVKAMGEHDNTVAYLNYREGTVPTGILMDVYPYILMVAVAAMALLVLMRGKRKHLED